MTPNTNFNQFPTEDREILIELVEYLLKNPSIFIDPHKLLRNRGLTTKKILTLFEILESEKLGTRIYPFEDFNHNLKLIPHFKFYFFNNDFFFEKNHEFRPDQKGALLEQEFFSRIYEDSFKIYTFRTTDSVEVDFIIQTSKNDPLWAIEIKKDQFIYAADLAGLHFFDKNIEAHKRLIVAHTGTRNNVEGKIQVMPINEVIQLMKHS